MKKLLIICGPTATGKTDLGISLARKLASGPEGSGPAGELVSADSRQVYKDMDIGTGKDLPVNSNFQLPPAPFGAGQANSNLKKQKIGFWETKDGVKIWGYDLVSPKEEFSVAQYEEIVNKIFKDIWKREKLPMLVGGTGFYIKTAVEGVQTSGIPKNEKLRQALKGRGVEKLFEKLSDLDPVKAASLNQSDRKNPRRLIRAIEIAQWQLEAGSGRLEDGGEGGKLPARRSLGAGGESGSEKDILFVGLKAPRKILYKRIEERVEKRLNQGLLDEIGGLLASGVGWDDQSMQAIGYKEWQNAITEHTDLSAARPPAGMQVKSTEDTEDTDEKFNKAVEQWVRNEKNYAKRQMTWFKKDKRINWFDITSKDYRKNIEKLVDKWYSSSKK